MKRRSIDTTTGPLLGKSFQLAWPAVLQALLVNFYAFNDFFFVGLLGDKAATAALSACFALLIIKYMIVRMIPTGATTLVAQYSGAKRLDRVADIFRQALGSGLMWSVVVGGVGLFFLPWIVELNNVTGPVGARIDAYLTVILYGAPAFALMFVVDGTFRGRGNTRVPLLLEGVSLVINTFLNWCLVLGNLGFPELGIEGAALATTISRALPGLVGVVLVFRGMLDFDPFAPLQDWAPRLRDVSRMMRIGFYESVSGVLYGAVYLMLNRMAGEIGPAAQGGLGAGLRGIEWIAFAFGDGFMIASVTIVGQNIGAGKLERAMKGAWLTGGVSAACCQLIGMAFIFFPGELSALVTDDPQTLEYASQYVSVIGWVMWSIGFEMVCYGAFVGAGRTEMTLLVSGLINIGRIPLAAALLFGVEHTFDGALWAAFGVGEAPAVSGVFLALAYTIAITAVLKTVIYFTYLVIRQRF